MKFTSMLASGAALAIVVAAGSASAQQAAVDGQVTVFLGQIADQLNGTQQTTVELSLADAAEACGVPQDILAIWARSVPYCIGLNPTDALRSALEGAAGNAPANGAANDGGNAGGAAGKGPNPAGGNAGAGAG